jgi:uncharacterized membrane protein YfcA
MSNSVSNKKSMNEILIFLAVGLAAGYMSGLVGIGGGLIIVPVLVYALGFAQATAQGTTLFMFLFPIGILGVMQYYKAGHVDWRAAVFISITFVLGNFLGSKTALSVDQAMLKKIFGAFIIVLGIKMLFWK